MNVGASFLAIVLGVVAFATGSGLSALGDLFGGAAAAAIISGVCGLVLGLAMRFTDEGGFWFTAICLVPAGIITPILLAGRFGDDANGYRFLDSHGAVVYALAGGVLGAIGVVAAALIRVETGLDGGVRTAAVAGVSILVVGSCVVVPLASSFARDPLNRSTVARQEIPAYPVTVGAPTFRIPGESKSLLTAAGPGFIIGRESVTAYDGATGAPRWTVDFEDFSRNVPSLTEDSVEVVAERSGSDTVHIQRGGFAVTLDANTGAELRRELTPSALDEERLGKGDEQRLNLSNGRVAVEKDGRVVVTGPNSEVVDQFDLPENNYLGVEGPDGSIVFDGPGERTGRIVFRDVAGRQTKSVSVRKFGFPSHEREITAWRITRVGGSLLVPSRYDSSAVLVNPMTGVVEKRFDTAAWCGPAQVDYVKAVPGSILVGCELAGGGEQIVGLR